MNNTLKRDRLIEAAKIMFYQQGVTGTTLAVIRDAEGTCVCVCEGTVEVGPRGGPMARVTRDRRRFVFRDGRPPEDAAIREVEGVELVAFRNRHRARLEGRASDRP